MRTVGICILGLIGGLLSAIVLQDILARVLIGAAVQPRVLRVVLGSLLPVLTLSGAVFAVGLDRRHRRPTSKDHAHD